MSRRKYLKTGECVRVIQKLDCGNYLVEHMLTQYDEYGNDHETEGPLTIERTLYDEAPTAELDEQIKERHDRLDKMNKRFAEITQKTDEARSKHLEIMKDLVKFKGLERLHDFITGKITHFFVIPAYGVPRISERDTALQSDDAWGRPAPREPLRLLSLFGKSNGDLAWRLNQYYDNSGSQWTECIPFCSYEEARAAAQARILEQSILEQVDRKKHWIKFAKAESLQYPEAWDQEVAEADRKTAAAQLAKVQKDYEKAKAKLQELEA